MAQRPDRESVKVSEPAWLEYPLKRLDWMIAVVSAIEINGLIRLVNRNTLIVLIILPGDHRDGRRVDVLRPQDVRKVEHAVGETNLFPFPEQKTPTL